MAWLQDILGGLGTNLQRGTLSGPALQATRGVDWGQILPRILQTGMVGKSPAAAYAVLSEEEKKKAKEEGTKKQLMDILSNRISLAKEFDWSPEKTEGGVSAAELYPGIYDVGYLKRKPQSPTWPGIYGGEIGEMGANAGMGEATISVVSPSGVEGSIPLAQLKEALATGYRLK